MAVVVVARLGKKAFVFVVVDDDNDYSNAPYETAK